jgi:hypothetical protein
VLATAALLDDVVGIISGVRLTTGGTRRAAHDRENREAALPGDGVTISRPVRAVTLPFI